MFDFTNQVVIVTGAAGNLGRAVALAFDAAGAALVLVDRAPDRLPALFPQWVTSARHFLAVSVDLTNETAMSETAAQTKRLFGRIDVLVNVAGGWSGGSPAHETGWATFEHLLDLNLRTAVLASQAVVPIMLEQGKGRIVNVAARAGLEGTARNSAYAAAKSGVIRLTESMAAELKKQGIHVNCVLPSTIDTPQNREAMPKADPGKWVPPEAIADVILFLASDAARAVHGAAIPVYGTG